MTQAKKLVGALALAGLLAASGAAAQTGTGTSTGTGGTGTGTGSGTGSTVSTTTPGVPETGAGGDATTNMLILAGAALVALAGGVYLSRQWAPRV